MNVVTAQNVAEGQLSLTYNGPLAEGVYSGCSVTLTDAAGNASIPWTFWDFEVDTTAPTIAKAFLLSRGGDEVLLTLSEDIPRRSGSAADFKIWAEPAPETEDPKPVENGIRQQNLEIVAEVAEIYFSGNGNLEDHEILLELDRPLDPSQYSRIYVRYTGSSVADEAGNKLTTGNKDLDITE